MKSHLILAALVGCMSTLSAAAAPVAVAGGPANNPTDITSRLIANQDLELTGGAYVVRLPQSGEGIVTAESVDPRIANFDSPGFSSADNPTIKYTGVISGNGTVTVQSAFKATRPAYGQRFTGGALIFTSSSGQTWGVSDASSGGRSPSALVIDPNATVEFYFPGEADRQTAGSPSVNVFPASTTVSRNITNNGFLFSTFNNRWGSITGTGVSSFAFFGGDNGHLGTDIASVYSGESFATANGLKIGNRATFETRPDGQPTKIVTRGLTVFLPNGSQSILDSNYSPGAPVKSVLPDLFNWGLNIQLWNNGIHNFLGLFLPTTASKSFLETAPVQDAVKGVYSYNGGGMAFGRVININHRATLLMGDGREVVTNADGVTNNVWLQGNAFNTLLSTSNFVGSYPGRNAQAVAYAYSGSYRVNHNFNAAVDASKGIIQRIRNAPWTNLYFLDPTAYNPQASKPNSPILTTAVFFAGLVRIDRNAVLQLGDGTTGNNVSSKTLTFSDGRSYTSPYSDSSGNGMLMTKGNEWMLTKPSANQTDGVLFEIANQGKLIVNNTPGALDATTAGASAEVAAWVSANVLDGITGTGSVEQRGMLPLTLGSSRGNDNSYTGGTTIAKGATLIAGSATAFGTRDTAAGAASGRVVNHGTLQAADTLRTITVPGDYVQASETSTSTAALRMRLNGDAAGAGGLVLVGLLGARRRKKPRLQADRTQRSAPLLSLAAALLLAACGGGGGSGGGGGGTTPAPVQTTPPSGTTPPPAATTTPLNTTLIAGAPTLLLTIGGSNRGVDYDTLKVAGRATLSGNLQLRFVNGYRPAPGQSFVVTTAEGGISGTFDAVNTEGIPVSIRYESTSVTVTVL